MPRSRPPVIVLAPASFKGSLGAPDVCAALARGIKRVWRDGEVRACPMADGGEGTLDAVLSRGGERRQHAVTGAGGKPLLASTGLVPTIDGPIAIIEVAEIVGITDRDGMAVPVAARSTWGVGETMRALLDAGTRRFMIGLGGSSTNDGGAGMLAALGVRFLDRDGNGVAPTPAGMMSLARVDATALDVRLADSVLTILSDVANPLCGDRGATALFGPQKGVRANEVNGVDSMLARYATLAETAVGRRAATSPGAGAAGGLGFALQLIGGTFHSGADIVANVIGLDDALVGADWAITGEGRSDAQTLLGKAPIVVARRAHAARVPTTLLSGSVDSAVLPELGRVFAGCFALSADPVSLADCIANAAERLADRGEQIARDWPML